MGTVLFAVCMIVGLAFGAYAMGSFAAATEGWPETMPDYKRLNGLHLPHRIAVVAFVAGAVVAHVGSVGGMAVIMAGAAVFFLGCSAFGVYVMDEIRRQDELERRER